jgi:L-Ala-D/L-Glu epimerase
MAAPRLTAFPLTMRFRRTFRIARGARDVQHNILVRFEHEGVVGWGEGAPSPYYHGQTMGSALASVYGMEELIGRDPFDREEIARRLRAHFPEQLAAREAVDVALHDWAGRRLSIPVASLLGLPVGCSAETSLTISLGTPEEAREAALEAGDWPILKLKLGGEHDLEAVRAVREVSSARLYVDANAAWTVREAVKKCKALCEMGVELIEQPIPPGNIEGLRWIHDRCPRALVADEDAVTSEDLPRLVGAVDGVNIKLAKTGGLDEAFRMATLARELGLFVMLGTMAESPIATSAAAQLLPLARWVDLDGPVLLLEEDCPAEGLRYEDGRIVAPEGPGLGLRVITRDQMSTP